MPLAIVYTSMNLGSITIYNIPDGEIETVIVMGTLVDADGLLPNSYIKMQDYQRQQKIICAVLWID